MPLVRHIATWKPSIIPQVFKVWLIVIFLGADGASILDVQRSKTAFDSHSSCERAKTYVVEELERDGKRYAIFCRAGDRAV